MSMYPQYLTKTVEKLMEARFQKVWSALKATTMKEHAMYVLPHIQLNVYYAFNQGDTGSPLIDIYAQYHEVHVGISSFVSGNGCESTDPSGYTRTLPYVNWIKNMTAA